MSSVLPKEWKNLTILDLGLSHKDCVQTGPFGAQLHAEDYVDDGVPLILIRNIKDYGLDIKGIPKITEEDANRLSRYRLKVGDIVFSRVGRVGSCFLTTLNEDGWVISGQTLRMRTSNNLIYPEYLLYALRTEKVQQDIIGESVGSTRTSINTTILENLEVNVPPLPEQKKIAAILTSVDEVIEKTQEQINKLKDLKTGMMQELLTRGVGVDGKPHTEFKDSPVGRIPKGWEVEALKEFTSFLSYGFTNPMPEAENGPYMITAKDINNLKIQYSAARKTSQEAYDDLLTRKSRPEMNDILLTKDGSLGRVALVTESNCCINQSVAVITPNSRVIPKFLLYLLASPAYQQEMLDKAGGSTIKHIYITVVDKMLVAVPSLEEQEKLVAIFDSVFCKLELAEKKFNKLKNTKKALMQDLLTGKVRVKVDS